jgi:hypothetical protein
MGQQRPFSGNLLVERGEFYDGDRTGVTFNRSRVNFSSRLSIEPSVTLNWIDLPSAASRAAWSDRASTYTVTPLLFVSALVQYNSSTHSVSTNARLRWEYRPGSELFIVYNEERTTSRGPRRPGS